MSSYGIDAHTLVIYTAGCYSDFINNVRAPKKKKHNILLDLIYNLPNYHLLLPPIPMT